MYNYFSLWAAIAFGNVIGEILVEKYLIKSNVVKGRQKPHEATVLMKRNVLLGNGNVWLLKQETLAPIIAILEKSR